MGEMSAHKLRVVTVAEPVRRSTQQGRSYYWRLLACAANAAIWMVACVFLDAGWLATAFAGLIGFLAAAMIVGAGHHHPHH